MRRILLLIAMVFAFAAVAGGASGHAVAYSSAPIAGADGVSICAEHIETVAVSFKQCRKTQSGVILPCLPIAVLPQVTPTVPQFNAGCDVDELIAQSLPHSVAARLLRPPITV